MLAISLAEGMPNDCIAVSTKFLMASLTKTPMAISAKADINSGTYAIKSAINLEMIGIPSTSVAAMVKIWTRWFIDIPIYTEPPVRCMENTASPIDEGVVT